MNKTIAKVEFRSCVPCGRVAMEFCYVKFYGLHAKKMRKMWGKIECQRYEKYNSIFQKNKKEILSLQKKASSIIEKITKSKPFNRFWYKTREKKMLKEINELLTKVSDLEEKNKQLWFFDAAECHSEIKDFLEENGFVLTSTTSAGDWCNTTTEIWKLEK